MRATGLAHVQVREATIGIADSLDGDGMEELAAEVLVEVVGGGGRLDLHRHPVQGADATCHVLAACAAVKGRS